MSTRQSPQNSSTCVCEDLSRFTAGTQQARGHGGTRLFCSSKRVAHAIPSTWRSPITSGSGGNLHRYRQPTMPTLPPLPDVIAPRGGRRDGVSTPYHPTPVGVTPFGLSRRPAQRRASALI